MKKHAERWSPLPLHAEIRPPSIYDCPPELREKFLKVEKPQTYSRIVIDLVEGDEEATPTDTTDTEE